MLYCENCHAPIPEESAACPYCGALNAPGGEKKYMERLYDLKEDVEELSRVPEQEYRKEMKKIGRIIGGTVLIFAIAAGIVCGAFFLLQRNGSYELSEEEIKAQLLWERENFPILDDMYAEGDYDGILAYVYETEEEDFHSISNWEHSDFLDMYSWYRSCKDRAARAAAGDDEEEIEVECIIDALFLMREREYITYSEAEESQIEEYCREVKTLIGTVFDMPEGDLERLYEESCVEDEYSVYFDYDTARKKVEKYVNNKRK